MGSPKKPSVAHRSCVCEHNSGKEPDSPLPPISERLAHIRPSKELVEFYKDKIAQCEGEQAQLLKNLEKYKSIIDDQHKLQGDLRQREEEIAQLQNALSDMQVYLYQEREQSLRLHAENDRLKIRELEDRKKMNHLLSLVGTDDGETTYFLREPPHKVTVKQKNQESGENLNLRPTHLKPTVTSKVSIKKSKFEDLGTGDSLEKYKTDNHTLILQVEALQAQMEEQTRLAREQVESLQEDRQIKKEEAQADRQRFQCHISALTEKLKRTQNLLFETIQDFTKLKIDTRTKENRWMLEKDRLLGDVNMRHKLPKKSAGVEVRRIRQPVSGESPTRVSPTRVSPTRFSPQPQQDYKQKHKDDIKAMQEDAKQAHRMAEMYREQCVALETELAQAREQGEVGKEIFKERSEKVAQRLKLMTQRYEALEKRRTLEVEGFKTDLRQLRQKFKDIEKQLIQVTLNVGPNQDLAILQEVRESNTRTKKVQSDLMMLKAKIYGLENELRFC
ncbi:coiled-coil domain-containing protein 77 isoform X2 [Phyllopteryx taeniolatus]|uniref:coiled-coil domain-containing protein 77 isoform X2 n=1 Tax=Phyllopteryx taeniolatus TaxID=161469 RepID=UPI002AD56856|nr:coiled-coil domain-containing protein 77 isoform X2 [Phyllopteryx taeniolatus]